MKSIFILPLFQMAGKNYTKESLNITLYCLLYVLCRPTLRNICGLHVEFIKSSNRISAPKKMLSISLRTRSQFCFAFFVVLTGEISITTRNREKNNLSFRNVYYTMKDCDRMIIWMCDSIQCVRLQVTICI